MDGDCPRPDACQGLAEWHRWVPWGLGSRLFPRWKETLVIFLRHGESWGFPGSPLLPEWNLLAFPLPKETWGVVDVIGFRVGLAFLLTQKALAGPHCAHLWLQFLYHGVQLLCPWLQIPALCWGFVQGLSGQREAAGESCWALQEGEGGFMFPARMFTWLRVGQGLRQHQPCCATPGRAAPEELIRACGTLVIGVTCQELLGLQKCWAGALRTAGCLVPLLGGSPGCSVRAHRLWRAEVVPLQALKSTSVLAVSWKNPVLKGTNGCWEDEKTFLISLTTRVWMKRNLP